MKVVILGAGSTIGTLGKRSLGVARFVERLKEVCGADWERDYGQLAKAAKDCSSENLDEIWTYVDYFGKLRRSLCERADCKADPDCHVPDCQLREKYKDVSGKLRSALVAAYSLDREIAALKLCDDFTLKNVLADLGPGDALISFNWDILAEQILVRFGNTQVVAAARTLPSLPTCVRQLRAASLV